MVKGIRNKNEKERKRERNNLNIRHKRVPKNFQAHYKYSSSFIL
jgi:DNA-binding ferritin-like protein (Dps family)